MPEVEGYVHHHYYNRLERELHHVGDSLHRDVDRARADTERTGRELHNDAWHIRHDLDETERRLHQTVETTGGAIAARLASSENSLVGALKDLRGDIRLDIAGVKAEVREAELRTSEHILRDGDRTRNLIHRYEDRRLEDMLGASRLENSDLKMRLEISRLRREDDDDEWRGRGRRRRGGEDQDTSVRQTVIVEDRQGQGQRQDERRDRHDRHDVDIHHFE